MKVAIIGLGLIGGSIAKDIRKSGFSSFIVGVDNNPSHSETALELGLVNEIQNFDDAIKNSDLIVVAIPVDAARKVTESVLDRINDKQIVTDVGSTKSGICNLLENHSKRNRFVAGHPIAGTENAGPTAAIDNLFQNKTGILCEKEKSSGEALNQVIELYKNLGMNIKYMGAEEHDMHISYVSHLSHISSFALGLTVLNIEKSEENIFDMAGSGFSSTVRLAKSSPEMWNPIFQHNSKYIVTALEEYIDQLQDFKTFLKHNKSDDIYKLMTEANEIRRILEGDKNN